MKKYIFYFLMILFSHTLFSETEMIKTSQVDESNFSQKLSYFGHVAALKQTEVVSYSKGVIVKLNFKNGDKVKKGDIIGAIKGYMEIKRERLNLTDKDNYKYIKIKSPSEGYILYKKLEGNAIDANDVICLISNLDTLLVNVPIFNEDIQFITLDNPAIISHNNKEIKGRIFSITPQSNSETQTISVIFSQVKPIFYPGEFVNITIPLQSKKALSIPIKAIVKDNDKKYVILKTDGGYLKKRVQTGLRNKNFIEIINGLQKKDTVVTDGAYEIFHKDITKKYKVGD